MDADVARQPGDPETAVAPGANAPATRAGGRAAEARRLADPLAGEDPRTVRLETAFVVFMTILVPVLKLLIPRFEPPFDAAAFRLDMLNLTVDSAASAAIVLYLAHRTGAPQAFGLVRPRWAADTILGVGLGVGTYIFYQLAARLAVAVVGEPAFSYGYPEFPGPRGWLDHALLPVGMLANSLGEELVCRAYLITRLERVLGSMPKAVVAAAVLFASYHTYQGPSGTLHALIFGLTMGFTFAVFRRVTPLIICHTIHNVADYLGP